MVLSNGFVVKCESGGHEQGGPDCLETLVVSFNVVAGRT